MTFDELFEHRSLAASKLKDYLRDAGYTKVSFASKANISRPTLDKILSGAVDSKVTFERHFQKILGTLNISADYLITYHSKPLSNADAVYSQNTPANHEMSEQAKKEYNLLLDIVDLCSIYY